MRRALGLLLYKRVKAVNYGRISSANTSLIRSAAKSDYFKALSAAQLADTPTKVISLVNAIIFTLDVFRRTEPSNIFRAKVSLYTIHKITGFRAF